MTYSYDRTPSPSPKAASSEEQWELASEILKLGERHPALAAIKKDYDAI